MKTLWQSFSGFSPRQKLAVGMLLFVIVLTWLGVCVVLGSYLV
jgi:hypothetical protein